MFADAKLAAYIHTTQSSQYWPPNRALCSVKAEVTRLGLHPKHMTVSPRSGLDLITEGTEITVLGLLEKEANKFTTPLPTPPEPQGHPPSQTPGQHT